MMNLAVTKDNIAPNTLDPIRESAGDTWPEDNPPQPPPTLLLVDDEVNILSSLKRLLRRDDYFIITAGSGAEGLEILATTPVDVIVSDQRMPGMTGVEFLSIAKDRYPQIVRLVLSGYTELRSVTDAINEGAIYKFLTKPWDDTQLRGHIREAFRYKTLADHNQRLTCQLQQANRDLATANHQLEALLRIEQAQLVDEGNSLGIVREALKHVPMPVIAIDDRGMIAFINDATARLFQYPGGLLGSSANDVIPELMSLLTAIDYAAVQPVMIRGRQFQPSCHVMGRNSASQGKLIMLLPTGADEVAP